MRKAINKLFLVISLILAVGVQDVFGVEKQIVKAIYIPLADHYAGIVAYEKYRDQMEAADYQIERMKSWPLLRAYFMSGKGALK